MICPDCEERIRGANKRKIKKVYYHKCRPEKIRNKELAGRLKQQYITALMGADYNMIDNLIAPSFWKVFTKHFEAWAKKWRSSLTLQTIDEVPLDEKRRLKNYFMDQILLGKIKPETLI